MEDEQLNTRVVKITMPKSAANIFIEECRLNYNDSRWLKIKFDDMMFKALYNQQPTDIKQLIVEVREELKKTIKEMYGVNLK